MAILPIKRPGWLAILVVLVIAEITSAFEVGMMFGALATVMREFRDPVGTGWLITAFLLVGAVSAALCSRLGDLYGRKRLVLGMLACATSGSLLDASTTDLPFLIAGRAIQGFGRTMLCASASRASTCRCRAYRWASAG
jgi:MFS family permease